MFIQHWLMLILLLLAVHNASCIRVFELKNSTLLTRPALPKLGANKSAFGFRTATAILSGKVSLLIADPIAFNADTNATSGVVFACNIKAGDFDEASGPAKKQLCSTQLKFNFQAKNTARDFLKFGTSIAVLDNEAVVVCAPGYTKQVEFNITAATGLCGLYKNLSAPAHWMSDFFIRKPADKSKKDYALCLGGYDAALALDSGRQLRLAVSGPFCERPGFNILTQVDSKWNTTRNMIESSRPGYQYFGFALTSDVRGNFFATSPLISSSDRLVLERVSQTNDRSYFLANGKYNEYLKQFLFLGYSATSMVTGSGEISALGAPYATDFNKLSSTDGGCVFLFSTIRGASFDTMPPHYCVTENKARFGTSVVSLGDLDNDQADDFAVGCPGCGSGGAVYIFFGSATFQPSEVLVPAQIIQASSLSPDISGFGFSLSAGDLNYDKLSDLVIGSTNANHVAVLLSNLVTRFFVKVISVSRNLKTLKESNSVVRTNGKFLAVSVPDLVRKAGLTIKYRIDELQLADYSRFSIKCDNPKNGWCEADEMTAEGLYDNDFQISLTASSTKDNKFFEETNFDDLVAKLTINLTLTGPIKQVAYAFDNQFCKNLHCELNKTVMTFTPLPEKELDLQLSLKSPPKVVLRREVRTQVRLQVEKPEGQFFGGVAIKVTHSSEISIDTKVTNSLGDDHFYSENKGIASLTDILTVRQLFTDLKPSNISLNFSLTVAYTSGNSTIEFELIPLSPNSAIDKGIVTRDSNQINNHARVSIRFNSSADLHLHINSGESTVVDIRKDSQEEKLLDLATTVHGSQIGPALKQVYRVFALTSPQLSVTGIQLNVSLPFIAGEEDLLLFFPRKAIFGSYGGNVVSGMPYISSHENGTKSKENGTYSECQPIDSEVLKFLFKPDISLIESDHNYNASGASRKRRAILEQTLVMTSENSSTVPTASGSDTVEPSSISSYYKLLDCKRPDLAPFPLRCITFRCNLSLKPRAGKQVQEAFLHLHARLWSPTYFKRNLAMLNIVSNVDLKWNDSAKFMTTTVTNQANFTQEFVFRGVKLPSEEFPWGYVVLAFFIGLWLLLLFILLLWYCNFFRRRRFDYTSIPPAQANDDDDDDFYLSAN